MAEGNFDNPVAAEPLISEKVANTGDYIKQLEDSPFRESRILRQVAPYIEEGRFDEGIIVVSSELAKRGVNFEYKPEGSFRRGTRIDQDGKETMILSDDYDKQPRAKALWSLLHRNMSLILQRGGMREDSKHMQELLKMDVAYAKATRLGATRILSPEERKRTEAVANDIEISANMKLNELAQSLTHEPRRGKI